MATRVEEAARGRSGGAEEATEAGRGGRRRSPRQK
ncbi:TXLNG isoform 2, partial [Pan troglodytes]